MANLIIKSSANDLVLQGSDASPAITVGATGTTTFAENATLSGTANNLGTATAGTLGSAIKFPAGHVIKTSALTQGATETAYSSASNNVFGDTVVTAAFTPTYNDSRVVIICDFVGFSGNTGGDGGWATRFKRVISGGATSYPTDISIHDNATNAHSSMYWNSTTGNGEHIQHISTTFIDSPATTSAITYTLQVARYNMETLSIGGQMGAQWHLWFQEISG